jgi:hypothetical protein
VRARKIEKAKPAEEAAGEKPPTGAGACGEGADGGVCVPWPAADAVIAIVATKIAWRTPTLAALWDTNAATGVSVEGAAAPRVPAATALAPIPFRCLLAPGTGAAEYGDRVGGRETGIELAGGGGGLEAAGKALLPECVPSVDAVVPACSTVCVVVARVFLAVETTWPAGFGVLVAAACPVALLAMWSIAPTLLVARLTTLGACWDTGPTALPAVLVVFWSAPVLDVVSAPTVAAATRGAALTVLSTGAVVDGTDGAEGVEGGEGAEGVEGAEGAEGVEGVGGVEGGEGTEGVEGLFGAAEGATLPVACVVSATVWLAVWPTSGAPLDSGFAVADPTQTSAPSRPSTTQLARREIVLWG